MWLFTTADSDDAKSGRPSGARKVSATSTGDVAFDAGGWSGWVESVDDSDDLGDWKAFDQESVHAKYLAMKGRHAPTKSEKDNRYGTVRAHYQHGRPEVSGCCFELLLLLLLLLLGVLLAVLLLLLALLLLHVLPLTPPLSKILLKSDVKSRHAELVQKNRGRLLTLAANAESYQVRTLVLLLLQLLLLLVVLLLTLSPSQCIVCEQAIVLEPSVCINGDQVRIAAGAGAGAAAGAAAAAAAAAACTHQRRPGSLRPR